MFSFSEMKKLQEEEKVLIALTSKFSDQLTRLKVEELALVSMLGKQEEDDFEESVASIETSSIDIDDDMKSERQEEIDLSVQDPFSQVFEEEEDEEEDDEEEDDDDDDNNQLKSFLRELSDKQKNM